MNRYVAGGFHFVRLGEILDGRYIIVHKLGKGGYAVVWLCWDQVEYCYVSLKICCAQKETEIETETVSSELAIYQHLQNFDYTKHFICPLLRHFYITGPNGVHLCMIFPVAGPNVRQNCTESNRVTTIERTVAAQYFGRQLAHAVAFLHAIGVVHGGMYQQQCCVCVVLLKSNISSRSQLQQHPHQARSIPQLSPRRAL
jgi:serine/threonine protein kinase